MEENFITVPRMTIQKVANTLAYLLSSRSQDGDAITFVCGSVLRLSTVRVADDADNLGPSQILQNAGVITGVLSLFEGTKEDTVRALASNTLVGPFVHDIVLSTAREEHRRCLIECGALIAATEVLRYVDTQFPLA